ncbi:hypothetical protein M5X00_11780 [Paenibacillus alvei]|uniref:3D domain-containing protein n=1 Tax=Paenibacillus alvei TaxID=44250 RepID=A0ABT4GYK9_PAEAL|nr:hypothetical protein [Paenibacillus alvei]MCY7482892.1 hypothetical protein [Paenibacillus alvei]MCY9541228.1 hypothetical protein [Paenibacillus alvei]MCY9704581.1 hypothetical protein [Paenibacillus alvei]MCY9732759.1 hypothetical protein [Paenibacillus alvei]MCY9754921.1 hypothetical protein [Paenibacillus alvei]
MAAIMISTALLSTGVPSVKADATYVNEDFTAFTGASGDNKPVFASGKAAYIGGVAVHPTSRGTGNWNKPIYPFGTMIVLNNNEHITIPGGNVLNTFIVEDTGDLKNTGKLSYRWIDVYFGKYSAANHQAAINFGKKKFSYTVIS